MLVYGDIERVNLTTGETFRRVAGNGDNRLESCCHHHTRFGPREVDLVPDAADLTELDRTLERISQILERNQPMKTRCKFQVESVKKFHGCHEEVTLNAVCGDSPENISFSKYTPTGKLIFTVTNEAVIGKIQPGQYYYVDLIPAEA